MHREKKIHSRKLHRTIVENYLCCIEMLAALAPSFKIHMHAVRWRGQGWKRTYLTISGHVHGCKKAPFLQDEKTQFCDCSQKSCLFHTFFHIFSKIAYFALGVTV